MGSMRKAIARNRKGRKNISHVPIFHHQCIFVACFMISGWLAAERAAIAIAVSMASHNLLFCGFFSLFRRSILICLFIRISINNMVAGI